MADAVVLATPSTAAVGLSAAPLPWMKHATRGPNNVAARTQPPDRFMRHLRVRLPLVPVCLELIQGAHAWKPSVASKECDQERSAAVHTGSTSLTQVTVVSRTDFDWRTVL